MTPKPILVLFEDGRNSDKSWVIEEDDGAYILKSKGNPVMPLDGKLFADLLGISSDKKWFVTPQPQHGENVFTIVNVNTEEGWVVPDDAEAMWQVDARLLFVPPTDPPRFPDNDLFIFERVESD